MAFTRILGPGIHTASNINSHNIKSTGIITATKFDGPFDSLTVSGNLSIGGTITYEDVTNIDSIGIITARSGVDVDDFVSVGSNIHLGNAGVITATTFSGSGASLTNLNGSNIASGTVPVARIGTGTKNTSTFYRGDGTFATVTAPAITAINGASNNRIVTSDGGTTVTAESELTFDGTSLGIGAGDDIRFSSGGWTGEATNGKIQNHVFV